MIASSRAETGRPKSKGYLLALIASLIGGAAGFVGAWTLGSRVEGDPSAGMANLALIGVILGLFAIGIALAPVVAVTVALLLRRLPFAWATGAWMALPLVVALVAFLSHNAFGSVFLVPISAIFGRFVARAVGPMKLATKALLLLSAWALTSGGSWFVFVRGDGASAREQQAKQTQALLNLDFEIYVTTYLPRGYGLTYLTVPDADDSSNRYVHLKYAVSSYEVTIYESRTRGFQPPLDCGPTSPEEALRKDRLPAPCKELFKTRSGVPVYREVSPATGQDMDFGWIYLVQGRMTIAVVGNPSLDDTQLFRIIESLEKVDPNEVEITRP